jgi:predicted O-methyltransferase YrrM
MSRIVGRMAELLADLRQSDHKARWLFEQIYWRYHTARHRKQAALNEAYDRRHGVDTATELPLGTVGVKASDVAGGNGVYRAQTEELFRTAMASIAIDPRDYTFVDIGSGKGKVLLMASDLPFKRIIGVEYAQGLHEIAVRNIAVYKSAQQRCSRIEAIYGDALAYAMPDGPLLLFIFNALAKELMPILLKKLDAEVAGPNTRPVFLMYTNIRTVREMGRVFEGYAQLQPVRRQKNFIVLGNSAARDSLK